MTETRPAPTAPADTMDLRQRKRILDTVFVLTVAVALAAVAVAWFLRVADLDLKRAARGAFLLAAGYAALAAATNLLRSRRGLAVALGVLQAGGVASLAVLWHLMGGLDNPMALAVLFLPVAAAAIVLGGWAPSALALLSIASVVVVALAESPGLRFDLIQLGLPIERFLRFIPALPAGTTGAAAGRSTDPLVALLGFALALVAFAALASALARASRTLESRSGAALSRLDAADTLFGAVARASSEPSVLVVADSGQVVLASDSFKERTLRHGEHLPGRDLFELVRFLEPAKVRALLAGGGELPFCFYAVGREPRVARLRVDPVVHGGTRYASVVLQDLIDIFYLKAALDGTAEPLLLIGSDERLRYFNLAASRLFGELHFGQEARPVLGEGDWRADPGRPASRRVDIRGQPYSAVAVAVRTPEAAEAITILRLLPGDAA